MLIKLLLWNTITKEMTGPYTLEDFTDEECPASYANLGCPLMFTGLADINGTEIYQGSILKNVHGDVDVIEWNEDLASWQFKNCSTGFGKMRIQDWQWEVIGNIYQHPELLR